MLASLLSTKPRKPAHVVAIDLGSRTTKAVSIQRRGDGFELVRYAVVENPPEEQCVTPEALGAHLRAVAEAVEARTKPVVLIIGVQDSLLRHVELPAVPVGDMRAMLKYNGKNYLQQDMPDHAFDCHTLGLVQTPAGDETGGRATQKARVLVGGTTHQRLDELQEASRLGGLTTIQVVPSLICTTNAFEIGVPDMYANGVVALVDVGFKNSTISILLNGELALSRVVNFGSDRLTAGLADAMGVSYAEAESIKVGLPDEVQGPLQSLIAPLGRELRASIDFFEHQQDRTVGQVCVSGGAARSQFTVESLQAELMVPTKSWNPVGQMKLALAPQQLGEIEQISSQLAVAVGGALAAL